MAMISKNPHECSTPCLASCRDTTLTCRPRGAGAEPEGGGQCEPVHTPLGVDRGVLAGSADLKHLENGDFDYLRERINDRLT